ncbi:hypothetical protein chiPu_0000804 [Chiloscyllium punctatum]|uniref:ZP domain-containing protein n=1 Tax=Chiloscyllium punctatum TaxID=137246 RepID=A0A401RW94_CHIPU|nr:hypothetical protein [Chiloscyllium punctatum]
MLSLCSLALVFLVSALIVTGAQPSAGVEPETCGAISLCWEVTSSLTSERSSTPPGGFPKWKWCRNVSHPVYRLDCFLEGSPCTLLLFDASGNNVYRETVRDQTNEKIQALTPCECYTSCLTIAGQHDICAASITDPMPPSNLTIISSSAHSLTVYWDKPAFGSFDWFQLDVHLLGWRGKVANPLLQSYSLIQSGTTFLIDGLPACLKVNVSLASVCEMVEMKKSPEIFVVANLDEDECTNATANDCPVESDCINTFDSFTCVCHQGYFEPSGRERACKDHGVFTSCEPDLMKIIVSKEYLADQLKSRLNLVLNDGSCAVKEGHEYYTFTITEKQDYCRGQLLINETHSVFKHVITNDFHSDLIIREEPLIFEVKCAYLRQSLVNMPLPTPPHIRIFKPVVQYHEEKLQLTMTLYKDHTFSPDAAYGASPAIWLNDDLYLEVKSSGAFGIAFVLQVTSCWATTTPDSQEKRKFHFLQDGCPNDETFRWHSANGASNSSRFSIKMFHFVEVANHPIYLHCQANICHIGAADCLVECSAKQILKRLSRDVLATGSKPVNGIVSVGPIDLWSTTESGALELGAAATKWRDLKVLLWLAGGIIGIMLLMFAVALMKHIIIQNTRSRIAHCLIE